MFSPSVANSLFRVTHTLTLGNYNLKKGANFNEALVAFFPKAWPAIATALAGVGGYSAMSVIDLDAQEAIRYAEIRTTHLCKVKIDIIFERIDVMNDYDIVNIWICNALTPYDEVRLFRQAHLRRIRWNDISAPVITKVKPLPPIK